MIAWQNDQNSFTPERSGFCYRRLRVARYDAHIDDTVAKRAYEPLSPSLDGNKFDLWKELLEVE
jgi:hypothetical protein